MKKNGDIDITCKNLTVKASSAINLKADMEVQVNGQQQVGVKSMKVMSKARRRSASRAASAPR